MKTIAPLLAALAFAALTGCSTMKIHSQRHSDFDFSTVETYEWVKAPAKILDGNNVTLNENLHKLLNNELAARGWKQVLDPDRADIQIVYYIKLSEHEEYTSPPSSGETRLTGGFTYRADTGKWGYNDQAPDLNAYTVEVGELVLLVYDPATGNKVWSGNLKTKIDRAQSPEKQRGLLRKVASKIIARIP